MSATLVLKVENIRGTASETIRIAPGEITRIERPHGGGKTTLACALAACLAREPDPLGFGRGGANGYQRRGFPEPRAKATLYDEDGKWEIRWMPADKCVDEAGVGGPPPIPKLGVWDSRDPSEGTNAEQARRWNEAIGMPRIGADEIEAAIIEPSTLETQSLEKLFAEVSGAGDDTREQVYDRWHSRAKNKAKEYEEEFTLITREAGTPIGRYGVEKAKKWHPPGWDKELESGAAQKLREQEQALKQTRERERKTLEDYLAARSRAKAAQSEHDASCGRLATWQSQASALEALLSAKVETTGPTEHQVLLEKLDTARKALDEAQETLETAGERAALAQAAANEASTNEQRLRNARSAAQAARSKLQNAQGMNEACPTCERPWEKATIERSRLIEEAAKGIESTPAPSDGECDHATQRRQQSERNTEQAKQAETDSRKNRDDAQRSERAARAAVEASAGHNPRDSTKEASNRELGVLLGRIEETQAKIMGLDKERTGPDEETIAGSETALEHADAMLKAARTRIDALGYAERAGTNLALAMEWNRIAMELSPDQGLRERARKRKLESLQKWIDRVRELAGLAEVRVRDGQILWKGLPLAMVSSTERWAARTAVRLAICARAKSPVMIVDGAERMSMGWRMHLEKACGAMAAKTGIAVLWSEAT